MLQVHAVRIFQWVFKNMNFLFILVHLLGICFVRVYPLNLIMVMMMMEAVNSYESSFSIYQTVRCYIPEDSHLVYTSYLYTPLQSRLNLIISNNIIKQKT